MTMLIIDIAAALWALGWIMIRVFLTPRAEKKGINLSIFLIVAFLPLLASILVHMATMKDGATIDNEQPMMKEALQ